MQRNTLLQLVVDKIASSMIIKKRMRWKRKRKKKSMIRVQGR
jgi:hypothetical protein